MKIEERKIDPKHAAIDLLLIAAGLVMLILTALSVYRSWGSYADIKIPTGFSFWGKADLNFAGYGNRKPLVTNLVAGAMFYLALLIFAKYPQIWNVGFQIPPKAQKPVTIWTRHVLCGFALICSLDHCSFVWAAAKGKNLWAPTSLLLFIAMALLLIMGVWMTVKALSAARKEDTEEKSDELR